MTWEHPSIGAPPTPEPDEESPWRCARCGRPLVTETEMERLNGACDGCVIGDQEWIGGGE